MAPSVSPSSASLSHAFPATTLHTPRRRAQPIRSEPTTPIRSRYFRARHSRSQLSLSFEASRFSAVSSSSFLPRILFPVASMDGVEDIVTMEQSGPYKPDTTERNEYYFGLDGKPKLVARTSSNRWTKPDYTGPFTGTTPKYYAAVKNASIIAKWNETLNNALIQVLKECHWSFFFPIRIGLIDELSFNLPTVLLVGVQKDTLSWERGINIALKCRQTLQDSGIVDIEVEVYEAVYDSYTAYSELAIEIGDQAWSWETSSTNILALPMLSSSVGYPVGYMRDCDAEGTIGLHLRLGDQNAVLYGLTCRHVVCHDRRPDDSYTSAQDQLNQQEHIHAGTRAYEACLEQLQKYLEMEERTLAPLQEKQRRWIEGYQYDEAYQNRRPTDDDVTEIADRERKIAYARKIQKLINKMSDKTTRRIGHLAFHPKLEMALDHQYLKDWALVRLDNEERGHKYNTNRVYIGLGREAQNFGVRESRLENGFLPLHLRQIDPDIDNPIPVVAKQGATTGLTFGQKSGIEAVIRRYALLPDLTTKEMVIVSDNKYKPFSAGGDSGSTIFNSLGAVIGLLTGSTKHPEEAGLSRFQGSDVTFATPIEWVLEDMARFTGLRPRMAEDTTKEED